MKMMKAWVVTAPGKLELKDVPVPIPARDEILVKSQWTCLCNGSDPGIYRGHESYMPPFIFGHESSGIVVEKGEDVDCCALGDLVFSWCTVGAFAEYELIRPTDVALFPVPKNLSPEAGPVMELVIAACRALMPLPARPDRNSLLVCGLGPSGLVMVQYARLLGYKRIVGWDLYENRRELALKLGADQVFDPAALTKEAAAETGGFHVAVDAMGDDILPGEPTFTLLLRAMAPGGTVVSYGHPQNGRRFSPLIFQGQRLCLVPPEGNIAEIREKGRFVLQAVEDREIQVEPLITHRLGFEDIGPAFQRLLERPKDYIKITFRMEVSS